MPASTPPSSAPERLCRRLRPARAAALSCCFAASVLTASPAARADEPPNDTARAVHLNDTGSELYAAGNYGAALQAFQRAYALIAEPNLLFNIAGCHERLGQSRQAIEYYRWFLDSPNGNAEGRRRAIEALSRLDATPAPPAPPALPAPAARIEEPSAFWPLATLSAGILAAGLGAGLYLDGAHDHNQVTNAPGFGDATGSSNLTEVRAQQLIESGDTKKLVGGIGIGVGSALIVTHLAITLWRASGDETAPASAELRLIPGGWAVAGKF